MSNIYKTSININNEGLIEKIFIYIYDFVT